MSLTSSDKVVNLERGNVIDKRRGETRDKVRGGHISGSACRGCVGRHLEMTGLCDEAIKRWNGEMGTRQSKGKFICFHSEARDVMVVS